MRLNSFCHSFESQCWQCFGWSLYLSSISHSESFFVTVSVGLIFNFAVMVTECMFIALRIISSSIIGSFLLSITLLQLTLLCQEKRSFIVFQTFLHPLTLIISSLQKYSFLVIKRRFVQKFIFIYSYSN